MWRGAVLIRAVSWKDKEAYEQESEAHESAAGYFFSKLLNEYQAS